jgi:glycosyltransferase involved in cell wall biosynthesis
MSMRVAIIVPRYGPDVAGGAETLARNFAETAVSQGWKVDVWTTCAKNHFTWENEYEPGETVQAGVPVTRFPITRWPNDVYKALNRKLVAHYTLPETEQYDWLENWVHSEPLYQHVSQHAASYDAVIALPYLSSLTVYAAWAAPEHVVMMPCLHDEFHAYLSPFKLLLETVRGVLFLSPEESVLAIDQLKINISNHFVLGAGIKTTGDEIQSDRTNVPALPYLLTIGRLEKGKNLELLYEYMQRFVDEGNQIKLVLLGRGEFTPPAHPAFVYPGFVSESEKYGLIQSALALCHPSLKESFSLVLMESWLVEKPVLVHKACAVTKGHVSRSGGGLLFSTYREFAESVTWFLNHSEDAAKMGNRGRQYVLENYSWNKILNRFEDVVSQWK